MDLEQKLGLLLIGALGAFLGFIGVCHVSVGDWLIGLLVFMLGFAIEAFAVKTYVEEMTK
jgi:uncharacterized membrane protein